MGDDNNAETILQIYHIAKQTQLAVDNLSDIVLTKQDAFNFIKVDEQQAEALNEHERRLTVLESALLQLKPWHFIAGLTVVALALLTLVHYLG